MFGRNREPSPEEQAAMETERRRRSAQVSRRAMEANERFGEPNAQGHDPEFVEWSQRNPTDVVVQLAYHDRWMAVQCKHRKKKMKAEQVASNYRGGFTSEFQSIFSEEEFLERYQGCIE